MSRRIRDVWLCVVFGLVVAADARAEFAAGDQVVSTENTELRGDDGATTPVKVATLLVVEAVNGTSLRVRETPDGVSALIDLGKVVASDKAIDYFTAKIKQNPKDARAYEIRGDYYSWKMDVNLNLLDPVGIQEQARQSTRFYWHEALADYNEAIRLGRRTADIFVNRASMMAMTDDDEEKVLADLHEAITLDPGHAQAHSLRGAMLAGQGDYQGALADLGVAARSDSEEASTHCEIARIRGSCDDARFLDGKLAVTHAEKALALALVVTEDMHHVAAAAYARAGDFAKAVEHATMALEMTAEETRVEALERLNLYKSGKPFQDPPQTKEE